MTIEEQVAHLERRGRRQTLCLLILAICCVGSGALGYRALHRQLPLPDILTAKELSIVDDSGTRVVTLGTELLGGGLIEVASSKGVALVRASAGSGSTGVVSTLSGDGKLLVQLTATERGGKWGRKRRVGDDDRQDRVDGSIAGRRFP